jgi:flagellar biosynthesis/type III secretory pathway protein FliH
MPIIPALGRWKQEDCKFETNLSCIVRACQKSESKKEGRKERRKEGGKEGRKEGKKEGRREGREEGRIHSADTKATHT